MKKADLCRLFRYQYRFLWPIFALNVPIDGYPIGNGTPIETGQIYATPYPY